MIIIRYQMFIVFCGLRLIIFQNTIVIVYFDTTQNEKYSSKLHFDEAEERFL